MSLFCSNPFCENISRQTVMWSVVGYTCPWCAVGGDTIVISIEHQLCSSTARDVHAVVRSVHDHSWKYIGYVGFWKIIIIFLNDYKTGFWQILMTFCILDESEPTKFIRLLSLSTMCGLPLTSTRLWLPIMINRPSVVTVVRRWLAFKTTSGIKRKCIKIIGK